MAGLPADCGSTRSSSSAPTRSHWCAAFSPFAPTERSTKSRISRFASTGWRPGIMWFAPSTIDQRSAGQLGEPMGPGDRLAAVLRSMDDEHRAGDGAAGGLDLGGVEQDVVAVALGQHRLDGAVNRPAHGILDRLRRVRLRRRLAEPPLGKTGVVPKPVVAVLLRPAFVRGQLVVERVLDDPRMGGASRGTPTANATIPRTRSGCSAASRIARHTPSMQSPTRTADAVSVASMTSSTSST